MKRHVKETLDIARGELGVREIGSSNTGRKVQEYQASTTLGGTGWPWCAAYVCWCEQQAAKRLSVKPVLVPSASCDAHLDHARRNNILSSKPQAGDLFLVMASKNDATHIGFVTEVQAKKFTTLEGNTNTGGSRNGNGVYSLSRTFSSRYQFIRWGNLVAEETAQAWQILIGNRKIPATIETGTAWVAAHQWAGALGLGNELGWHAAAQAVTLQGRVVEHQAKLISDGQQNRAWLPVRVLAEFSGLKLKVEPGKIEVFR